MNSPSHLMNTYNRLPVSFVRGEGCYLYDEGGQRYFDAMRELRIKRDEFEQDFIDTFGNEFSEAISTDKKVESDNVTADRVRQLVYHTANADKIALLIHLLRRMDAHRTLIFVNDKVDTGDTRHSADFT